MCQPCERVWEERRKGVVGHVYSWIVGCALLLPTVANAEEIMEPILQVKATHDFQVTGQGDHPAWEQTPWTPLNRRGDGGHDYATRFKVLYSETGLYVLMDGEDRQLTATLPNDFDDLWNEDVFEFFLWPDERHSVYFEYEISPLGRELPILVPQLGGEYLGWRPWHYEGDRKIQKRVWINNGEAQSNARIDGWRAEVFLPYALLSPLQNVPPRPGTHWRANFYRVDHDGGTSTGWDWARVGESFHEIRRFGTLRFE